MSKYFTKTVLSEIIEATDKIKNIRNGIYLKYGVDILDNDSISLSTFFNIIRQIDPEYNCNFSRNGEDGYTIIDGNQIHIETKSTKVKKNKKGKHTTTTFAFHAKGLINHDAYIFNVWDKKTLDPVRCYYVKKKINVEKINSELKKLSEEWEKKPLTKGGYDVIRIDEKMLLNITKEFKQIDNCKVYVL